MRGLLPGGGATESSGAALDSDPSGVARCSGQRTGGGRIRKRGFTTVILEVPTLLEPHEFLIALTEHARQVGVDHRETDVAVDLSRSGGPHNRLSLSISKLVWLSSSIRLATPSIAFVPGNSMPSTHRSTAAQRSCRSRDPRPRARCPGERGRPPHVANVASANVSKKETDSGFTIASSERTSAGG